MRSQTSFCSRPVAIYPWTITAEFTLNLASMTKLYENVFLFWQTVFFLLLVDSGIGSVLAMFYIITVWVYIDWWWCYNFHIMSCNAIIAKNVSTDFASFWKFITGELFVSSIDNFEKLWNPDHLKRSVHCRCIKNVADLYCTNPRTSNTWKRVKLKSNVKKVYFLGT